MMTMQAVFDRGNEIIDVSNPFYDDNSNNNYNDTTGNNDASLDNNNSSNNNIHCIICLMDYHPGDIIYRNYPYCHHFYHTTCIQPWVVVQTTTTLTTTPRRRPFSTMTTTQNSYSAECPCCRSPINSILLLRK